MMQRYELFLKHTQLLVFIFAIYTMSKLPKT